MAFHPEFPESPYAPLIPSQRWFPADETLRSSSYDKRRVLSTPAGDENAARARLGGSAGFVRMEEVMNVAPRVSRRVSARTRGVVRTGGSPRRDRAGRCRRGVRRIGGSLLVSVRQPSCGGQG
jgi:hypothetical protein